MCDCFKTVLEKIEPMIKPEKCEEFSFDWRDRVLRFDGGIGVGLYVQAEYYKVKKDGSKFANKTKDSRFMALSYCPFCGEKITKPSTPKDE